MGANARLAATGAAGLTAYAALAWATRGGGAALGWLLAAQAAGWLALAAAWRVSNEDLDTRGATARIVAGALLFRLCGLATAPGWEDDYFRHLWDGWMTLRTGSPYGVAPLEWFGGAGLPAAVEAVLDGVNNPERATIYGPVAQVWGAAAAWQGAGELWIFKTGLVVAEGVGLWALWRAGGTRALLFAGWCPLAVTEVAFAGHVDALVFAAVAAALLAAKRNRATAACGWLAAAVATKAYALLFAPFFLWRAGWRGAVVLVAVLGGLYAPWVLATVSAGRAAGAVLGLDGVGTMAGCFEFNSTGYAVLAWALGDEAGRWVAGLMLAGGWLVGWAFWVAFGRAFGSPNEIEKWTAGGGAERGGAGGAWSMPGAAVAAWWALWSPVFHPWYALMALPFLALRPTGWGVGLLAALPLSYAHGLALGAGFVGATGDFRHPWWVRPLEAAGVALAAFVGRGRVDRPNPPGERA